VSEEIRDSMRLAAVEASTMCAKLVERLIEEALTTTLEPFEIHLWAWTEMRGGRLTFHCAGGWTASQDYGLIEHAFGEVAPWPSAAGASTDSTPAADGAGRGGSAPAGAT
jgi:hypothetical protein